MPPPSPLVPSPLSARQAIDSSAPLRQLVARRRQAELRLAVVRAVLPAQLQPCVEAGGLDDERWVMLVDGAAAAAKLRQLLPSLQAALRAEGLAEPPINVRVRPR